MTAQDYLRQAQSFYSSANFRRSLERAVEGLDAYPDDAGLLRLAGQCSLELGLDDASIHLHKAVEVAPDDAGAWHDLGLCLLQEGDPAGAVDAFRQAVRLQPEDATTLVDFGHTLYALGQADEAITVLSDAAKRRPDDLPTLRSLVELYRHAGRPEAALEIATAISERRPGDVPAMLDAAELHLVLGHLDNAVAEYGRLQKLDVDTGHEIYAYHGMVQAEIVRERWRRALDLAIDAAAIDRYDVTTQLLAYVAAQLFGKSDRPAPTWAELEAMLATEREAHRRQHLENLPV